jgi:hypothetical protein
MVIRFLLLASLLVSSHLGSRIATNQGVCIDPNGGLVTNGGSFIDPNGGLVTNGGSFIDPNGGLVTNAGPRIDPNGVTIDKGLGVDPNG